MNKKVIHVYKTFFPETKGGGEQVIYFLCKDLAKHNIESKVLCLTGDKYKSVTKFDGIEVIRYPYTTNFASCPLSISLLKNFRKEIAWADIIHYHYPWPFGDLLSLLAPKNKKQIVTYHSDIIKQKILKKFYYPLEQYFLSKVDKIIATSPNYVSTSENLKKFQYKTEVVTLGINPKLYSKPNAKQCSIIKNKFGDNFILFIGQLRYYKGLHLLITAMKDIKANLVIIGQGTEELKLKNLCKQEGIDNVHFLGQLQDEEKVNYLNSCYALALTSHLRSEAFGIALLEGAMFAKPLISCRIGTGTEYININNETGFTVPTESGHIKDAIVALLKNPDLAKKMGQNAKKRFDKLFTSEAMAKGVAKIIEGL